MTKKHTVQSLGKYLGCRVKCNDLFNPEGVFICIQLKGTVTKEPLERGIFVSHDDDEFFTHVESQAQR